MVRPTINSLKHIVQTSLTTVTVGTVNNTLLITALEPNVINAPDEVRQGAVVKAVFIERWVKQSDTIGGNYVTIVHKLPANAATPTAANMAALHDWGNKKNILFSSQGLLNDQNADATPVLRQWIKIPKGKQRFGAGDKLYISHFAQALDSNICGLAIYKEYF